MSTKNLPSDIARMFNRAICIFKKESAPAGESNDHEDEGAESRVIAPPDAFVIDHRVRQVFASGHVKHLYDHADPTQYSADRWFAEILLKKLEVGGSEGERPIQGILFLIYLYFRPARNGKLSSCDGLRILEHIRFTESLPDHIRFAPAVLYGFESPQALLERSQHPLLTQGAGVALACIPEHTESFSSIAGLVRWKAVAGTLTRDRLTRMLHPSMTLGGGDLYAHSYRNIAGASKFCREFAGDILGDEDQVFARFHKKKQEDLHLKRLMALMPHLQPGQPPSAQERASFEETCRHLNFLVIDDEHAEGWSLGLYSGITGSAPIQAEYDSICSTGVGQTSDGRMGVIARFDENFVDDLASGFQRKLNEWSAAFENCIAADTEFQKAASAAKEASVSLQGAEYDLFSARQILGLCRRPDPAQPDLWLQRLRNCAWNSPSESLVQIATVASTALQGFGAAGRTLRGATDLSKNADQVLDNLATQVDDLMGGINQILRPNSRRMAEAFVESSDGNKVSERLLSEETASFFGDLSKGIEQYRDLERQWAAQVAAVEKLMGNRLEAEEGLQRAESVWVNAKQQCEEALAAWIQSLEMSLVKLKESKENATKVQLQAGFHQNQARLLCSQKDAELRKAFRYNLVFLDLRIDPRRDNTSPIRETSGMKILDKIRAQIPVLPVIMMTASDKTESLREAYWRSADYWVKGIGTGEEMRTRVLHAAERAALLPLWVDIQKVGKRSYLKGLTYVPPLPSERGGHFKTIHIPATEKENRENITRLLEDAFRIIWEYSDISSHLASEKSHRFNPAITCLGIIQELRIRNMTGEKGRDSSWKELGFASDSAQKKEGTYRELRNSVSHSQATVATRKDALEFLQHTVKQLLS